MATRRRKLVWARNPSSNLTLTPAAAGLTVDLLGAMRAELGLVGTANLPGMTVARVRLSVFAASLTAGAIPFWVGIRTINIQDLMNAAPTPGDLLAMAPQRDPGADWMLYSACYPNHGSDPSTGVPNAATYDFDVKSMRKLDEMGQTLVLVAGKETSTNGVTVSTDTSVLLMLP